MDTTTLQIFVEVVRRGSFAAVARDRDLDPSAVSRSIRTIEDQLGVRLFQRTTRRLSLTEAGKLYFDRIAPLAEELDQAGLVASDVSKRPSGTLRVTTSVSFGQKCIVTLLPRFVEHCPDLTIDLLLSDSVIDIVAEGFDVAIRLGGLVDSTLVATRLVKTRYFVCASPGYLQSHSPLVKPGDLRDHNCLLFPMSGFRSRWIFRDRKGKTTEVPVKGRMVVSAAVALGQLAVAGMGPVLLPHWVVADDLKNGTLIDAFPEYEVTATDFETAVWFVQPSRTYVPLKVLVFRNFLRQAMRHSATSRR